VSDLLFVGSNRSGVLLLIEPVLSSRMSCLGRQSREVLLNLELAMLSGALALEHCCLF